MACMEVTGIVGVYYAGDSFVSKGAKVDDAMIKRLDALWEIEKSKWD